MKNLFKIFSTLLLCAYVSGGPASANTPGEVTDSWNTNKAYTKVQDNLEDSLSALIIFDRSYTSYRKYIKDEKLRFEISTTVHRRIKILSASALDNFNKVYVPSVGDMFIKNEITEIKGRTIKLDGTVIDLDSSDVRETTLPANVPFYSQYNGKVKLFALPGINVGDEVEYFYTVKNDIAERKSNFQKFGVLDFEMPYPCLEKSHILSFNKEFSIKSYSVHTGINLEKLSKEDNDELVSFKVTTKNLPATVSEAYSLDYKNAMSIYFHIYESNSNEIDNDWKEVSKLVLTKANKYTVVGNKLWMTFNNEIRKQKSFQKKVEKAAELINEPYLEKKEYLEGLQYRTVSRYNLSLINNIANAMDATVNLWYVADKTMTELKENIPSTLQFNDVIVEFVKGKKLLRTFLQAFGCRK